jgi:hypothetical protein
VIDFSAQIDQACAGDARTQDDRVIRAKRVAPHCRAQFKMISYLQCALAVALDDWYAIQSPVLAPCDPCPQE